MINEEKQLLLKDLCSRLPYGVIVDYKESEFELPHWKITTIYPNTFDGWIGYDEKVGAGSKSGSRPFEFGEVKPYLRPMSSMTEEEKKEYTLLSNYCISTSTGFAYIEAQKLIEWLDKNMFDHRGLIPMGLALEAMEGMYKDG